VAVATTAAEEMVGAMDDPKVNAFLSALQKKPQGVTGCEVRELMREHFDCTDESFLLLAVSLLKDSAELYSLRLRLGLGACDGNCDACDEDEDAPVH